MDDKRDVLGIYIPRRISQLGDQEILEEILALQARRASILSELTKEKEAARKPKKDKVHDLTKMDSDDALTVLAAQMGMSVDELKRLIAGS